MKELLRFERTDARFDGVGMDKPSDRRELDFFRRDGPRKSNKETSP